jgi:hypothetical protein
VASRQKVSIDCSPQTETTDPPGLGGEDSHSADAWRALFREIRALPGADSITEEDIAAEIAAVRAELAQAQPKGSAK